MAMVPIGIESLMIALLILITGKYKAGSTTPPAAKLRGHSVPVRVCLGNAQQVQSSLPSTENSSKVAGGAEIPCLVHGYSIRCRSTPSITALGFATIGDSHSAAVSNRRPATRTTHSVRTAIAAAGAAEVGLSEGQTTAINRVASGEVPAAVLALVSAEAAEAFPEIAGFRIFRVPLSPRALKGRPNTP